MTTKSHRKGGFSVVMYANLDAHEFCRGYGKPLAMMGVALNRYLPGCNAMLGNEAYVKAEAFTPRQQSAHKCAYIMPRGDVINSICKLLTNYTHKILCQSFLKP